MRFLILALAALLTPAAAIAQEQEVVVRADVARTEIERILDADNMDTAQLSPREVADAMSRIGRGRAPEDFWSAYQQHVQAWAELAHVVDRLQPGQGESAFTSGIDGLDRAQAAIGTTFDEVERIARHYRARIPAPLVDTRTIA